MSQCLSGYSIDHVVLERGEVANSWKHERWDSLRLLTPNWQTQLPGFSYKGEDPDGYMTMPELLEFLIEYANHIEAPLELNTAVTSLSTDGQNFQIVTSEGNWECESVVVATGACNKASVPTIAEAAPASIEMLTSMQYRNPAQLQNGSVLVVGASATGLQLAEEIHRSGRPVTLAVGEHVRLPRTYRDKDIQWWLDALGILDERYDEIDDIVRGRNIPSPQLVGTPDRSTLDLNRLSALGVRLRGRLVGFNGEKALFSGSLRNVCELSDLKMRRLLNTIDEWIVANGLDIDVSPRQQYADTKVEESPPLLTNLAKDEIKTILWATGYYPDYSWLDIPLIDRKGKIRHDGGIVDCPGMYLMGMNLLRRRKSSFIHGASDDAHDLSAHLVSYLNRRTE
jgi:putative flavoprotein involved in K+ transport